MRILIAGAGVAGLVLGLLLKQQGMRPVVVEQNSGTGQTGYAIGLWPLGSCVLKGLGLFRQFEEISLPLKRFRVANWEDEILQSYPVEYMGNTYGFIRMVKRSDLTQLLLSRAADMVRYQKSLVSVRQDTDTVTVEFADGEQMVVDVLVGCDGVHSRVREQVFDAKGPRRLGWTGWGWWADKSLAPDDEMTEYWNPGKGFCAVYPAQNALCVFVGLPDGIFSGRAAPGFQLVKSYLSSMKGVANRLVNSIPMETDSSDKLFQGPFYSVQNPLWHDRRVVLAGDAASAYFPFGGLGIGASMAMESAAVLANELSRTDARFAPQALSFYQKRRRARVSRVEAAVNTVVKTFLSGESADAGFDHVLAIQRSNFQVFKDLLERPI
jgi:FAD-dependent urate hydroxylase